MLEHPTCMWQDEDIKRWIQELTSFVTHMCMFDLHVPETHGETRKLIRKSTRLLVSHPDMQEHLRRRCPGAQDDAISVMHRLPDRGQGLDRLASMRVVTPDSLCKPCWIPLPASIRPSV